MVKITNKNISEGSRVSIVVRDTVVKDELAKIVMNAATAVTIIVLGILTLIIIGIVKHSPSQEYPHPASKPVHQTPATPNPSLYMI